MPFDYGRYQMYLALERSRLNLAEPVIFDPTKHPRGFHGRWAHAVSLAPSVSKLFGGAGRPADTHDLYSDGKGNWTPERKQLHQQILHSLFAGHTPKSPDERIATLMAGGTAAGKSSLVDSGKVQLPDDHVKIDPDQIKQMLPEWKHLAGAQDRRAATITHEESGYLARMAYQRAIARGYNVVMDATGKGDSHAQRIDAAHAAGHQVHVITVTKPVKQALADAAQRGTETGRVVAPHFIHESYLGVSHTFRHQVVPRLRKIAKLEVYDNTHRRGALIADRDETGKLQVHDVSAMAHFIAQGDPTAAHVAQTNRTRARWQQRMNKLPLLSQ